MFTSLRFRLWLTYAAVAGMVLCIATAAIFAYILRNPVADRREVQRLRFLASIIVQRSQLLEILPEEIDSDKVDLVLQRADTLVGARVAIYSPQGELIGDSRAHLSSPLPAWSQLKEPVLGGLPTFRDVRGTQWLYVVTPIDGDYMLLLASPRARTPLLGILRDELLGVFTRGAIFGLILSLLLAFWIAHWISHPLRNIEQAARAVSGGEFLQISTEEGPKEVKELASAFNEMIARVQSAQQSQRDFVANVSHDLKTPLTSIQGYAQAILDGAVEDQQEVHKAAQVIHAEATRMNRMVSELLDLARLDSGAIPFERKKVHLAELLNLVVDKFQPLATQADVKLKIALPLQAQPETSIVIGDAERLSQLFSNLVDNAIKFSPPKGEVVLTLDQGDDEVVVKVIDQGPGIPQEEAERIFERFYQMDKARTGGDRRSVGLGLAIAKEIAQKHGGGIKAYNRTLVDGLSGAVFVVNLPLAKPDKATPSGKLRQGRHG